MQLSKETSLFNKDSIKDDIQTAGQGATSYITKITNDGIFVHQTDSGRNGDTPTQSTAYGVHISDDVDIIRGGEVVASYGSEARIGKQDSRYVKVSDGGMQLFSSASEVARFGYGTVSSPSGTTTAPYFTLGDRLSGSVNGMRSVAIGNDVVASGAYSLAGGSRILDVVDGVTTVYNTTASGNVSFAFGTGCEASAHNASSFGDGTIARGSNQFVVGKFNVADTTSLFIIGKGGTPSNRSNAFKVDGSGNVVVSGSITSAGAKVPTRNQICYANSRVDNFSNGKITLSLSSLGITTGAKPVGILLTYQDGDATPTILQYDYDASSASGVVIKAYNSSGAAVNGNVRYFAVVFQNSWTSVT